MASVFPEMQGALVRHLDPFPAVQFEYLRSTVAERAHLDRDTTERYVRLLCEFAPFDTLGFLTSRDDYSLETCLAHCRQFQASAMPSSKPHRLSSGAGAVGATRLSPRPQVKGAITFLLERMGDIDGATRLAAEDVRESNAALARVVLGGALDDVVGQIRAQAPGRGVAGMGQGVHARVRPWEQLTLLSAGVVPRLGLALRA